ncbi:MAG: response regulator, partial [Planctomycetaceae bacterium]|nr:response regulator [Planctomycetaceae bacterium]
IFDPFTQDERAPERSEGGLGIGLTLVRSLVRMHEGSVEARSEGPGRGSEFLVRLPLLDGEPAPVPVAPEGPLAVGTARSWRVLVIDDNVPACRSLALILGEWGHVVRVCHDGAEALATARDFRPEVVLLDIGLPDMDGLTVARRLRDRPEHRNTMLIAMTGLGHDEDRRRSLEAGFDDHLVKPLDLDALENLLADLDPSRRSSPARLAAPLESGLFSIA